MEAILFSEMSVIARATQRIIPEDGILKTNQRFSSTTGIGLSRNTLFQLLVTAIFVTSSRIFVTLMMEAIVSPKLGFLQYPHGITAQKTSFFIVTAVNTSNLIKY
jgi:hypothetical protein